MGEADEFRVEAEEVLTLLDPANVAELEGGWIMFTAAAEELGISRQALHKQVFLGPNDDPSKRRTLRTVRKVTDGKTVVYLLKRDEVAAEKQRRQQRSKPVDQ